LILAAILATALAVVATLAGIDLRVASVRIRVTDPFRPLLLCTLASLAVVVVGRRFSRWRWSGVALLVCGGSLALASAAAIARFGRLAIWP
jgi:uncharacterized membrane protein